MIEKINLQRIKDKVNFYDLAMYFEEEKIKVSYNGVMMCCPFHKEKTPSFFYKNEKKNGWCFACHKSADIFDYVIYKTKCSFVDSIKFLLKFTGEDPEYIKKEIGYVSDFAKQNNIVKRIYKKNKNEFKTCSEEDVREMIGLRGDFFKDRNLLQETLDEFEVGFDPKRKRVTVPIRDKNGVLVGITGRTIYKDYKNMVDENGDPLQKWKHYFGSRTGENIFNIKRAIEFGRQKNDSVIIVEGPNDVMKLYEYGYKNVIAVLSNNLTYDHKMMLLKNFLSIYLFLDDDLGGETGKSSMKQSLNGYFDLYEIKGIEGKDPDEMTKEQVDEAIKNAIKI